MVIGNEADGARRRCERTWDDAARMRAAGADDPGCASSSASVPHARLSASAGVADECGGAQRAACACLGLLFRAPSAPPPLPPRVKHALFHVLLCVTLLLNGMASAVASAHVASMDIQAVEATKAPVDASPATDAHCPHSGRAMPVEPIAGQLPQVADDQDEDCRTLCLELCMQHFQALVAATDGVAVMPSASSVPVAGPVAPATMRPHLLLRPPIST